MSDKLHFIYLIANELAKMFQQITPSIDLKFARVDPIQEKENIDIIREYLLK